MIIKNSIRQKVSLWKYKENSWEIGDSVSIPVEVQKKIIQNGFSVTINKVAFDKTQTDTAQSKQVNQCQSAVTSQLKQS